MEHALYGSHAGGGYRFLAKSSGFLDEWLPLAERLCMGFGERPPGVSCPACVFAQSFGKRQVAVVQAADQGNDDAGRPGALAFYLVVLPRATYSAWGGDPFALADRFPPAWQARGEAPPLPDPLEPPPPRTVDEVQRILKQDVGPNLLGAAQALVDGGRVVFQRQQPDPALLRNLWSLLPTRTREDLWPASFAFGNDLGFHALATPRINEGFENYVNEEQAGDYPEGRYERGVQVAAETGDQPDLDALFARRSRKQTLRLGIYLMMAMLIVLGITKWIAPTPAPEDAPPTKDAAVVIPNLPTPDQCRTDDLQVREQAKAHLRDLAQRLGLKPTPNAKGEDLLEEIDKSLGTPDPKRSPGSLRQFEPVQRELRVLLWKHGVAEYADLKLNSAELAERLRDKVAPGEPK
ncbi:MAG TPA: hypothetical protein VGG61_11760 [Gemmataceae bacterium]